MDLDQIKEHFRRVVEFVPKSLSTVTFETHCSNSLVVRNDIKPFIISKTKYSVIIECESLGVTDTLGRKVYVLPNMKCIVWDYSNNDYASDWGEFDDPYFTS